MKMNKIFLMIFALALITVSCKKTEDEVTAPPSNESVWIASVKGKTVTFGAAPTEVIFNDKGIPVDDGTYTGYKIAKVVSATQVVYEVTSSGTKYIGFSFATGNTGIKRSKTTKTTADAVDFATAGDFEDSTKVEVTVDAWIANIKSKKITFNSDDPVDVIFDEKGVPANDNTYTGYKIAKVVSTTKAIYEVTEVAAGNAKKFIGFSYKGATDIERTKTASAKTTADAVNFATAADFEASTAVVPNP